MKKPEDETKDEDNDEEPIHRWTYEIFLEVMGLAKMAAENQGNDKMNHSVLRELFQSLDYDDDAGNGQTNGSKHMEPAGDGELSATEIHQFMCLARHDPPISKAQCDAMLAMAAKLAAQHQQEHVQSDGSESSLTVEGFVELMTDMADDVELHKKLQKIQDYSDFKEETNNWKVRPALGDQLATALKPGVYRIVPSATYPAARSRPHSRAWLFVGLCVAWDPRSS